MKYLSSDLLTHMSLSEFALWCELATETPEASDESSTEGASERITLLDVGDLPTLKIEKT